MGAVNFDPKLLYGQQQLGKLGGLTVNPTRVAPAETTGNQFGISIPQNHSYTNDENGNKISLGLDGVGLAHKNPNDYKLHLIA
jgi:hypothetical protein